MVWSSMAVLSPYGSFIPSEHGVGRILPHPSEIIELLGHPVSRQGSVVACDIFSSLGYFLLSQVMQLPPLPLDYSSAKTFPLEFDPVTHSNTIYLPRLFTGLSNTEVLAKAGLVGTEAHLICTQLNWTGHIICMLVPVYQEQVSYSELNPSNPGAWKADERLQRHPETKSAQTERFGCDF